MKQLYTIRLFTICRVIFALATNRPQNLSEEAKNNGKYVLRRIEFFQRIKNNKYFDEKYYNG